jgi:hypothetical protein
VAGTRACAANLFTLFRIGQAGFDPSASCIATALYFTGIDPLTKEEVYVAKSLRDRKMQRALMRFFKPENYFTVREALLQAGRADLIGTAATASSLLTRRRLAERRCARRWAEPMRERSSESVQAFPHAG